MWNGKTLGKKRVHCPLENKRVALGIFKTATGNLTRTHLCLLVHKLFKNILIISV